MKEVQQTNVDDGIAYLLFLAVLCQPDPADIRQKPDPPHPYSKGKFGGSRAEIDTRLPWYPSGFV